MANKDKKEYDYEGDMAMSQLRSIIRNAQLIHDKILEPTTNLPEWVQSKIILAKDYIETAANYLQSEMEESYIEEAASKGLAAKAKASGVSLSVLRKVYRRGVAAWNSGHRPGTNPHMWGMARVNSYITKGKGTYHGADKDLREEEVQSDSRYKKKVYHSGIPDKKAARVEHWRRADKLSDRDPEAYKPAPGDETAKTKPSIHTLKYRRLYGEERGSDSKGHFRSTESGAGMTKKGVEAFKRENPGSKLQTAVTGKAEPGSKDAKRRKSFCARMSGMPGPMKDEKGRPTRKAMSLKRWRCKT